VVFVRVPGGEHGGDDVTEGSMGWHEFEGMRVCTLPGVFEPSRSDTRLLWRSVMGAGLPVDGRVLEVCTGSGVLALAAAGAGGRVTAVDIARRAVLTARLNALLTRRRVDVRRGDLFGPVAGRQFDLVLANPPYIPLPPDAARSRAARAWDGGVDGRALLDRVCTEAPSVLAPGGTVALVHSSLADLERTEALLAEGGLSVRRLAEHRGPLGDLAAEHAAHLRAIGVVESDPVEQMAVIAGTAPGRVGGAG
jgi:release factor glutamine methyltransferase